jgi:hypothetical protein
MTRKRKRRTGVVEIGTGPAKGPDLHHQPQGRIRPVHSGRTTRSIPSPIKLKKNVAKLKDLGEQDLVRMIRAEARKCSMP